MINTYKFILVIICTLLMNPCSAFFSFFQKKPSIAAPYVDNELTEMHFTIGDFQNKLGYSDEYLLLYGKKKEVNLYNMDGKILRTWQTNAKRAQILENCNLMLIQSHIHNELYEKDFAGNIISSFKAPGHVHHDFEISDNGHLVFLFRKNLPENFELNNGCNHDEVEADGIMEIDQQGKKYFKWYFYEHYGDFLNSRKCNEQTRKRWLKGGYSNKLDWIHPNAINILKDNKWYREGHKAFKPGNIMVTAHHLSKIIIINKETGQIVWEFNGDKLPLDRPHEAKMIPEGLPGAGNVLIYDNGSTRKYTRIIEINPIEKHTLWTYQDPGNFYNKWSGTQQRLIDGNTFISDDVAGRAFIVNKDGEIQWQFSDNDGDGDLTMKKRPKLYLRKDFGHCINKELK